MKMNSERFVRLVCVLLALVVVMMSGPVLAQEADDAESELAKKTQNPVADLISVPFQNNINFEVGDGGYTQNILNIQPVYPVHLNDRWNLITRTIVPVVHQPPLIPGTDREFGLGDVQFNLGCRACIQIRHGHRRDPRTGKVERRAVSCRAKD
jgi:hypothetical protein